MRVVVKALVIRPDSDTAEEIAFERGDVRVLQREVGGWIEGLPLGEIGFLFCNEEGKLQDLPRNRNADRIVAQTGIACGEHLVGTVVLTGPPRNGEITDVTPQLTQIVLQAGLDVD